MDRGILEVLVWLVAKGEAPAMQMTKRVKARTYISEVTDIMQRQRKEYGWNAVLKTDIPLSSDDIACVQLHLVICSLASCPRLIGSTTVPNHFRFPRSLVVHIEQLGCVECIGCD